MTTKELTDEQLIEEAFSEAFVAVFLATDPCLDCNGELGSDCVTCDGLGKVVPRAGVPVETRELLARAWEAAGGEGQVVS